MAYFKILPVKILVRKFNSKTKKLCNEMEKVISRKKREWGQVYIFWIVSLLYVFVIN